MSKRLLGASLLLGALICTTSASAAPFLFSISGPQSIVFLLDSSPTPTGVSPGLYFTLDNVTGFVNNKQSTFYLGFGSTAYFANFGFFPNGPDFVGTSFTSNNGIQLYSGSENRPTFRTGTFALAGGYNISIADVTPAVPEPATWAMMLVGFGMVAGAARYRRRSVKVFFL